jgi:putative membrane protein
MTTELILRYVHFISIFTIVGALVAEHLLLKPVVKRHDIRRLAKIDGIYGFAAIALVAAGLTLWLGSYGKPAEFYTKNWVFHIKLSLFVIIGVLSLYPTVFFLKKRSGNAEDEVRIPKAIFWIVRIELLLLFVIPLLAGMMARGIGYFGT